MATDTNLLFKKKKNHYSLNVSRGSNWGDDGASVFIPGLGQPSKLSGARMESSTRSSPKLDNLPTSAQSSGPQTDLPHGKVTPPLCGFHYEGFRCVTGHMITGQLPMRPRECETGTRCTLPALWTPAHGRPLQGALPERMVTIPCLSSPFPPGL